MGGKDVFYFSHDANALSDPKILAMRCDFGFEGYGLYFAILEILRNESTYKLPLNKNTYRAIKMQTGTTIDVEKFINACITEYKDDESGNGLFNTDKDRKVFYSASFLKRMQKYEDLKEKRRKAANTRWENKQETSKSNTSEKQKQCKCIKGYCKSNALAYKRVCKSNASLCKLNQIKSNEIKLNKIRSIYPSNHKLEINKNLDQMIDEMDKIEFDQIICNCEMRIFSPTLAAEMTEIIKEMYVNPLTKAKIKRLNSKSLSYALKNFAIANTRSKIQVPKSYFKKCIETALQQTELSDQFDLDTIYEQMEDS